MSGSFKASEITCFRFTTRSFDPLSGIARLGYGFDDRYTFTEEFWFPPSPSELPAAIDETLHRLLLQLHLAAGVSYFKAAVPARIEIDEELTPLASRFHEKLYRKGLGEFSYRNRLPLSDRIKFPLHPNARIEPISLPPLAEQFLIPLGGGKDSLVTTEILRRTNRPLAAFVLGDFPPIERVAASAELPLYKVRRFLDPKLFELNSRGAYNGHVPISAIFAFTSLITGLLHGYRTIVGSQERSSESGNVFYDGIEVNHQYSKSLEFERDLKQLISCEVSDDIAFVSLLRPLSEVHIARLFAKMEKYHEVFTSCNRSFRLREPQSARWCGDCPKCRFVFLALAPFLSKAVVTKIFGKNLLEDESQLNGFSEILGFGTMKPFECVGEFEEVQWCLRSLLHHADWQGNPLIARLDEIGQTGGMARYLPQKDDLFRPSCEHELTPSMKKALYEFLAA